MRRLGLCCERVLANADVVMKLRAVSCGGYARRCSGRWGLRGAAVRADNGIEVAGAAALTPSLGRMAQLTSLNLSGTMCDIGGSWRCERVLAYAGNALMMMRALGRGGCAWGVAGGGACEGRAEGRRCVQAMRSDMMGRHR